MSVSSVVRRGAFLGFCATAALVGALYLLAQLGILSFVPLDLAEAMIRVTPGVIATQGIEALGPLAKLLIEISGILLFLLSGTGIAVIVARQRMYTSPANSLLVGLSGIGLTVVVQALAGRFPDVITLGTTAALIFVWSFGLLALLDRVVPVGSEQVASVPQFGTLPDRRVFLRQSGGILLTVAVGSVAVAEAHRRSVEAQIAEKIARGALDLPGAPLSTVGAGAVEPGAGIGVVEVPSFTPGQGVRPELTPSDGLYVVTAAVRAPHIKVEQWQLIVSGLVERPLTLSYDALRALPHVEQTSTLTCVSNEVGGGLSGNITWSGVRLRDLLQEVNVKAGAVDVVLRSVDGYSDSIPLERALDPTTLVVYGMNGSTLDTKHGFPARLIVPGMYGMKNVKWLEAIEVVGTDYQGYWQERGWSDTAVVKTFSTIDTGNTALGNRREVQLEQGFVVLGGYAFAGDRGIRSVEVQIDDGDWQAAELKPTISKLVWQQWRYVWQASPGEHMVAVRATDGVGQLQTSTLAPPHPDGSSGWHTLKLIVRA